MFNLQPGQGLGFKPSKQIAFGLGTFRSLFRRIFNMFTTKDNTYRFTTKNRNLYFIIKNTTVDREQND